MLTPSKTARLPKAALLGALLGLSALAAAPVAAAPATYTFSGTGDGVILAPGATGTGNGFSGAFSFTFVGDTALAFSPSAGVTAITGPVTVSIAGHGTGVSTNPIGLFDNGTSGVAGLSDAATGVDVFDVSSPAFSTYDLRSSLGPVPITLSSQSPFQTSIGTIQFADINGATFTADVAPVPEASSVASLSLLLVLGAGAALARRRTPAARA